MMFFELLIAIISIFITSTEQCSVYTNDSKSKTNGQLAANTPSEVDSRIYESLKTTQLVTKYTNKCNEIIGMLKRFHRCFMKKNVLPIQQIKKTLAKYENPSSNESQKKRDELNPNKLFVAYERTKKMFDNMCFELEKYDNYGINYNLDDEFGEYKHSMFLKLGRMRFAPQTKALFSPKSYKDSIAQLSLSISSMESLFGLMRVLLILERNPENLLNELGRKMIQCSKLLHELACRLSEALSGNNRCPFNKSKRVKFVKIAKKFAQEHKEELQYWSERGISFGEYNYIYNLCSRVQDEKFKSKEDPDPKQ